MKISIIHPDGKRTKFEGTIEDAQIRVLLFPVYGRYWICWGKGERAMMTPVDSDEKSYLSNIVNKYKILRDFLKEQEWCDGEDNDKCPWCGVPRSHGSHNHGCYFDKIEKATRS